MTTKEEKPGEVERCRCEPDDTGGTFRDFCKLHGRQPAAPADGEREGPSDDVEYAVIRLEHALAPLDGRGLVSVDRDYLRTLLAHYHATESALAASKAEPMLPKRYLDTEIERMGKEHDAEVAELESALAASKAREGELQAEITEAWEMGLGLDADHARDYHNCPRLVDGINALGELKEKLQLELSAAQAEIARLRAALVDVLHEVRPPQHEDCITRVTGICNRALHAALAEKESGDAGAKV